MLKIKLQQNLIIYFENEDNMQLVKKKTKNILIFGSR